MRNATAGKKAGGKRAISASEPWELRLYIAGRTTRADAAFANVRKVCDEHLPGEYRIEVIDLLENPQLAGGDEIVAVPTLVRRQPAPIRRIIGDMSDTKEVLVGLDLRRRSCA